MLGGAANAEVSLIFSQQQDGRLGSYIFTIVILGLVTIAGVKLSIQNGTPGFSTMQRLVPVDALYAILSGVVLAGLVLGSQYFGGGFNEAYDSLIQVIRSSPQPWWTILLTSFQAGVMEEILYRFFALNLMLHLIRRTMPKITSKTGLWISAVGTAILFGLIPTHTLALSIVVGLLLAVLYLCRGLAT